MLSFRSRRKAIKELVLARVQASAELRSQYAQKRVTRFWHRVGRILEASTLVFLSIVGVGLACFLGVFLVGVKHVAAMMGWPEI